MICSRRRGATGMTGFCEIVRCSRAAFILAGNKQQSITTAIPAAHGAILGIWSPAATAVSAKPVTETQVPAFPIDSGTMRTSSAHRLPQWAEAVSRNIAPTARSGAHSHCFYEAFGEVGAIGQFTCAPGALACIEQNSSVFSSRETDTAWESEATLPLSPRGTFVLRLYAAESLLEPANIGA